MKLLFDTHAFVWFLIGDSRLPARLRETLTDPETQYVVSAVSIWEIASKVQRGRWPEAERVIANLDDILANTACLPLAITLQHARLAGFFQWAHRDPFDRILAAQSQIEAIPLLSADRVFRTFGTAVMW